MNTRTNLFLGLSLGISSATLLVDRFVYVSDWVAYLLMVAAVAFLGLHFSTYRKSKSAK